MASKKKILLALVLFGIVFLALGFFVIYPLVGQIKKISETFISQKAQLEGINRKRENLQNIQAIFETYKTSLEKIDKLFVNKEEPVNFIEFLEKLAVDSDVLIEISLAPVREEPKDPWPSLGIRLTLAGSLPNCLRFFEKLEQSSYLIQIQDLTAKRLTEKDIRTPKYATFSIGDAEVSLLIKAFAK